MTIDRVNPPGLIPPHGHSHVVRVTGGTTLYLAGQGAFNADAVLVGVGDHYADPPSVRWPEPGPGQLYLLSQVFVNSMIV